MRHFKVSDFFRNVKLETEKKKKCLYRMTTFDKVRILFPRCFIQMAVCKREEMVENSSKI